MSNKKKNKAAKKNRNSNEAGPVNAAAVTAKAPPVGETADNGSSAFAADLGKTADLKDVETPVKQAPLHNSSQESVRAKSDAPSEDTAAPAAPPVQIAESFVSVDTGSSVEESDAPVEEAVIETADSRLIPDGTESDEAPSGDAATVVPDEDKPRESAAVDADSDEVEAGEMAVSVSPSPDEKTQKEDLPKTEEAEIESEISRETGEPEKSGKSGKSKKSKEPEKKTEHKASEDAKKTSPWKRVLIYASLIIALGFAFLASNYLLLSMCYGTINVHNGDAYNSKNINISMFHPFPFNALEFWMDGKDITNKVQYSDSTANITMNDLPQGNHVLWIGFKKDYNPLTLLSVSVCRKFDVDTEDPIITLNTPDTKLITRKELYVLGQTEPDTRFNITVNDEVHTGRSDSSGRFYAMVNMDKETNKLRIVTIDKAGNRSKLFRMFILDETPPNIAIAAIPKEEDNYNNWEEEEDEEKKTDEAVETGKLEVLHNNDITLKAEVFDTGSGVKDCYFEVDGEKIKSEYNPENRNITIDLKDLDEGEYTVKVLAEDQAGWKSQKEWSFVIDSREEPGNFKIRPGALGHDVEIIQGKLKKMGFLDKVTGKFDKETRDAVVKVQKKMNLPVTGIVDKETFLVISEKINVYLGDFTLQLLSPDGKLIRKYPIACGSPYYPTPVGDYFVREKVYYPAWIPPPSPWARGAKPIPPGPGNPLGTRWIGLNAEIVGIHGTPSSWSIGSASSHGCIRMYISDVEELFELVSVGTPVTISNENSPKEKEKDLKKPGRKDNGNNTGGHEAGMEDNI